MKKAAIGILLLLPLLTGCWDRLPLKNLHLIDMAAFDVDEESGDVVLHYIISKLDHPGQGGGDFKSEITELKGNSLIEAVGEGDFTDEGPFLAIHTSVYFLNKRFVSHDPVQELAFLLHAPYTAINIPVLVLEDGSMSKILKSELGTKKDVTKNLHDLVFSLKQNGIAPEVTMMQFVLSREDPLGDIAMPVLKQTKSGMELGGALLFHQGTNTGKELDKDQVRMLMLMLGKKVGRQPFTGNLSGKGKDNKINYGFSVKKNDSKMTIQPASGGLPKVKMGVELQIHIYELGKSVRTYNTDYVNRMEKELSKHLEGMASEMIKTSQKANCDVLGIGKQLKAYHPNIWKSLNWRKDYPQLSIEPNFDVQILNPEAE